MRAKKSAVYGVDNGASKARRRLTMFRLIALGLCFATVFALTMAFGNGLIGGQGIGANVAEAFSGNDGPEITDDDEVWAWTANPFFGDNGDFNLSKFTDTYHNAFPGWGTVNTWSFSETFNNHNVTTDNQSLYKSGGSGSLFGDVTPSESVSGYEKPTWTIKMDCSNVFKIGFGFYYELPSSIAGDTQTQKPGILQMFNVRVTVSFTQINKSKMQDNRNYMVLSAVNSVSNDDKAKAGKAVVDKGQINADQTSVSLTLQDGNKYLLIGMWGNTTSTWPGSHDCFIAVQGLTITFNLTLKGSVTKNSSFRFDDGAAPVWGADWNYYASRQDYTEPYRTEVTAGQSNQWPVLTDKIDKEKNYSVDSDGKYLSYQGQQLGTVAYDGNKPYYKHTQLTATDAYNFSGTMSFQLSSMKENWATARSTMGLDYKILPENAPSADTPENLSWGYASYSYAAGIRDITIEIETENNNRTVTINTYSTLRAQLTAGDEIVGYVNVTRSLQTSGSNRYNCYVIDIYMYKNATLYITTTDYGDLDSTPKTLQYGGIDPEAPTADKLTLSDEDEEGYFSKGSLGSIWYNDSSIAMTLSVGDETPIAPNFYYIAVEKLATTNPKQVKNGITWTTFEHRDDWDVITMVSEDEALLQYDFNTGQFRGMGRLVDSYSDGTETDRTGSGRYLFRIYCFDMAGNSMSQAVDYYINVDYDKPHYTAEISHGGNAITAAQNGTWATDGDAQLTITPDREQDGGTFENRLNISGNTLMFEFGDMDRFVSTVNGYDISDDNGDPTLGGGSGASFKGQDELGNTIILTVKLEGGAFVLTFKDEGGASVREMALTLECTLLVGAYTDATFADADTDSGYAGNEWKGGIKVLVDQNRPQISNFSFYNGDDAVPEAIELTDASGLENIAAKDRQWYHGRYLGASLMLAGEGMLQTDYVGDIRVRAGVKAFDDIAALKEYLEQDFATNYTTFDKSAFSTWFDRFYEGTGDSFEGELLDIPSTSDGISLRYNDTSKTAGLRLIYVWAVDQAGNCSELKSYYMFVDDTNYNVTAELTSSSKLPKNTASVSLGANRVQRGDEITVTLNLSEGYVPYMLTLGKDVAEDGKNILFANYGANVTLSVINSAYDGLFEGFDEADGNVITLTYKFDSEGFGDIAAADRVLGFKHRMVVRANVGRSNRITYKAASGEEAVAVTSSDLNIAFTGVPDDLVQDVKNTFVLRYTDADGQTLYKGEGRQSATEGTELFEAIDAGTYNATVYIPKNDEAYVLSDVQFGEDGEIDLTKAAQTEIVIEQKTLYVVPTGGEAVYGEAVDLTSAYALRETADGEDEFELAESEGALNISLKLDRASETPDVGDYDITYDTLNVSGAHASNYSLQFAEEVKFTVKQREVNIVLLAATKTFGDPDPTFTFGVKKEQFDSNADTVLSRIFAGFTQASTTIEGYAVYLSHAITRAAGETAGTYDFNEDISKIVINSNYALKIDDEDENKGQFTIEKRNVTIAVTGSTVLQNGTEFDSAQAKFGYSFADGKDNLSAVVEELNKLLQSGLFVLGDAPTEGETNEKYEKVEYYTVSLSGEYDGTNLELSIAGDGNKYYVYTAKAAAVIIRLKEGARVELTYGTKWTDTTTITFAKDLFEYTQNGAKFTCTSATFTSTLLNAPEGEYLPVGTYTARITSATFYNQENQQSVEFVADDIPVWVKPAEIVINPKFTVTSRTYGADDSAYGISFAIATVGGMALGDDDSYANMKLIDFEGLVGDQYGSAFSYARAVFSSAGSRISNASRYDGATIGDTHLNVDGNCYSVELVGTLRVDNNNFTLKSEIPADTRLDITPKHITLDLAKFVGISKDYDGTNVAFYLENNLIEGMNYARAVQAYNLKEELLFGDDVRLSFDAIYSQVGSPAAMTPSTITFSNIALAGGKAANYVIHTVKNSQNNGAKLSGNVLGKDQSNETIESLGAYTIEISYLDNTKEISQGTDITNNIVVRAGAIGVFNNDLSITKVYDGKTRVGKEAKISISNRLATDGTSNASPHLLLSAYEKGNWQLLESYGDAYANIMTDANCGDEKYIRLALFFDFAGSGIDVSNITIANGNSDDAYSEYAGSDVVVTKYPESAPTGILVYIPSFSISVTQRVIDGDSFSTLTYKDRAYNGGDKVAVDELVFADGAIVESDRETLGLTLIGSIGSDVGAGAHEVTFKDDKEYSGVANTNYRLDIESINKKFSGENVIKVNITKAQLIPNIIFVKDRAYNAETSIDGEYFNFLEQNFTTLEFAEELASELAHLTLTISSSLTLTLCDNAGKADANVYEKDGSFKHSVMLGGGLTLTAEEGIDLIRNYELYGKFFDTDGNEDNRTFEDGMSLDGLVMADVINVLRATIQIMDTDVNVHEKVYDGTAGAIIDVKLPADVPENDRPFLTMIAEGSFATSNVGTNIAVVFTADGARFVSIEEKYNYLLNNYEIAPPSSTFRGNIVPRPVSVTVDLGEKTYDAFAAVNGDNIKYTFLSTTMLDADAANYNVQTSGGAFFDGPDVKVDDKGVVTSKLGTVYGPILKDSKTTSADLSNYCLVSQFDEAQEGLTLYAVLYKAADGSEAIMLAAEYLALTAASGSEALAAEDGTGSETGDSANIDVIKYYYNLPTASKYILASNNAKYAQAVADDAIIGYVEFEGNAYWLVSDAFTGTPDGDPGLGTLSYIRASGTIQKQTLTIGNSAARMKTGSAAQAAFNKQYDGTTKFSGVLDTHYTFDRTNLVGLRDADKVGNRVYLTNITGEFNSAATTATQVIFKGTLAGSKASNYILSENSQATLKASITKRSINAHLADGEMTYGTLLSEVVGDITYKLPTATYSTDGTEKELELVGSTFYVKLYDFLEVVGFIKGAEGYDLTDNYIKQIMDAGLFVKEESGEFTIFDEASSADDENEQDKYADVYLKLSGDFLTFPTAKAAFRTTMPNAGAVAGSVQNGSLFGSYRLQGGNATNFKFDFVYTDTVNRTSHLTVLQKDVYVSATKVSYSTEYGGSVSKGQIAFYDGDGNPYAFAAGESYKSLFVVGPIDYGPQFSWYRYALDGSSNPQAVTYPDVSNATFAYVGKFAEYAGADYNAGTAPGGGTFNSAIKNYRFHFGNITHVASDGTVNFFISFVGSDPGDLSVDDPFFRSQTCTIDVTLPQITGISVKNGEKFSYDEKVTDVLGNLVTGLTSNDTLSFRGTLTTPWDNVTTSQRTWTRVNEPGTYMGKITLTRTYKWNDQDTGKQATYECEEVTFEISPQVPSLSAKDESKVYDGKLYKFNRHVSLTGMNLPDDREVELTYEKLVGSTYYPGYVIVDGQQIPVLKDDEGYYAFNARGNRENYPADLVTLYAIEDSNGEFGLLNVGSYRVTIALTDHFVEMNSHHYDKTTVYAYVTITVRPVAITEIKLGGADPSGVGTQGEAVFAETYDASKDYKSLISYTVQTLGTLENMEEGSVLDNSHTEVVGLENVNGAGRYAFRIVITGTGIDASNYSLTGALGVLELKANHFLSDGIGGSTANDSMDFVEESVIANRLVVRHIGSTGGTGSDIDLWNKVNSYMPAISENATLLSIVQVQLYYGNNIINTTGKKMTLTIKLPEGVNSDLEDVVIYVKNRQGGLEKRTDYVLKDGTISFTTDYLGEIVFVDVSTTRIPSWLFWTVIAVAAFVATFVIWLLVAYIIRKVKLKKLV